MRAVESRSPRIAGSEASVVEGASIGLQPIRSWFLAFGAGSVAGAVAVFFTSKLVFLVGLERDMIDSAVSGVAIGFVVATATAARARALVRPHGSIAKLIRLADRITRRAAFR